MRYTVAFQGRGDFTDLMGRPVSPTRNFPLASLASGEAADADA